MPGVPGQGSKFFAVVNYKVIAAERYIMAVDTNPGGCSYST